MNDMINERDKEFANEFSRFVNGKMCSASKVGAEFANDHRFLVNEKFKVMMAFMEQLAINYQKGYYDLRNEWACTLAHAAIEALREQQLYYPSSSEYSPNKQCSYDKQIDYTTVGGAVQAISALFTGRQEEGCHLPMRLLHRQSPLVCIGRSAGRQ